MRKDQDECLHGSEASAPTGTELHGGERIGFDKLDAQVIAAIRGNHLKANIGWIENKGAAPMHCTGQDIIIHWERAWIDPGGTIFGPGPYLHVPITGYWGSDEETVHRVYAPARLRRKLARMIAVDGGYSTPSENAVPSKE